MVWISNQKPIIHDSYLLKKDENVENLEIKKGDHIILIGYPNEYQGKLYQMRGAIKSIQKSTKYKLDIFYHNIDTTHGQSGSPIFAFKKNKWILIGIHRGFSKKLCLNVGLLIN